MWLSLEDKLAIHEVIALYGHLIDERKFSRLNEIFTSDALFDLSGYGGAKHEGLVAIQELMLNSKEHPLAHHASNIVIDHDDTYSSSKEQQVISSVMVLSKGLGVGAGGRVGSVVYRDRFVRIDLAGTANNELSVLWRIQSRNCQLRSLDTIPLPS